MNGRKLFVPNASKLPEWFAPIVECSQIIVGIGAHGAESTLTGLSYLRSFQELGRSTAYGENAMVATSHPFATREAAMVLAEGGSAADAAITAAAVLCIAEPQMTGIGGDCFWIHMDASGKSLAYNGSGRTPSAAHFSYYVQHAINALDPWSAHAVTIPGAIDAWCKLHELKGCLPLARLFAPAIQLAEDGCIVHPRVAWDWVEFVDRVERLPNARSQFTFAGKPPQRGAYFAIPKLGSTLRAVAACGRNAFYFGATAESLVAVLRELGGLHTLEDFAAHHGEFVELIETRYHDRIVLECPPNGQGITALIMLNILSLCDLSAADDALRTHYFAEATKLAYADRDAWCADPAAAAIPVERLLSLGHAKALAAQIDPACAMTMPRAVDDLHRDTVYLAVVDRDLNAVSFINSLFHGFGSGIYEPSTGILLHNRGLGFCFDDGHPNCIDGGKRPLHTIIPGFVCEPDGTPWMPFGVMGGQYQAAGHAQLITHLVARGFDPQEAIDEPRTFAFGGSLEVESTVSANVIADLSQRGHSIKRCTQPIGGAQAIQIDRRRGLLLGGSDARKDGFALGL